MLLSVVIVNYNVKYFLEQCLQSVLIAEKAMRERYGDDSRVDIWVVDNNSTDGSVQMIENKFPNVRLIANPDNRGFATANNQALSAILSKNSDGKEGEFILLLNPDTLVQRDTFCTCIDFFASHPDCGGLSVKMINGEGQFLKESKRGFPSPATSFYKISGLINIFPHNKKVGAYYLGHLDDNDVNEVDVLPGAFLMVSRQALQKTGLLDESYFMYGEDIDFSWSIRLAGFKNYYLPTTRILHYKGESTRKASMNYVYTFYNAMAIFARKYFSNSGARTYSMLIQLAIWMRASVDFLKRIAIRLALPALDFILSFAGFVAIKQVWATYWASNVNYYPAVYTWLVIPLYIVILLFFSWLAGGYDKPLRIGRIIQGMSLGALCLLVFYSLLDESMRFSRAIVLCGALWSIVAAIGVRGLLSLCGVDGFKMRNSKKRRYLAIGSEQERARLARLFDSMGIEHNGLLAAGTANDPSISSLVPKVDEVIFCSRDIGVSDILDLLQRHSGKGKLFRILPDNMEVLIGSNYTGNPDDLYTSNFGDIGNATNRRSKRLFDIVSSTLILVLSPLLFWPQKRKRRFFADTIAVLSGRKSWVGYSHHRDHTAIAAKPLPAIKRGIFLTRDRLPNVKKPDLDRLDYDYANNYHLSTDITILFINLLNI